MRSAHRIGRAARPPRVFAAVAPMAAAVLSLVASAAQIDVAGPAGSNAFGTAVAVLPNGNIVVTDPDYALDAWGAVYLYSPAGIQIGALTGSTKNDHVGSGGIVVLANGDFVVLSPLWANGAVANAGAVTRVDGTTGISDSVSPANSLVGSNPGDQVGSGGVTALANGNYVVASPNWDAGGTADAGAAAWASGHDGLTGTISAANALIGNKAGDHVGSGGVTALSNGNYVVSSPLWDDVTVADAGAVTWGDGTAGIAGVPGNANSLTGAHAGDHVGNGGVRALVGNGNYVVVSFDWANGSDANAGAATWGSGAGGVAGPVTNTNSIVGAAANDHVGSDGITPLTNGNYVVASRQWANGGSANAGAVTWGNGAIGTAGAVSPANSLVGSTPGDQVSETGVTALSNGNYVVVSRLWDDGGTANAGAATWGNGAGGTSGPLSAANSLVGASAGDRVGSRGVVALANGNYAVSSPLWDSVVAVDVGAVTLGDGLTGSAGKVSAANSLTGSATADQVGSDGGAALADGSYVACSSFWDHGGDADVGAVTRIDAVGAGDVVTTANSLAGAAPDDRTGSGGALAVGVDNVAVRSPSWNSGLGAVTWLAGGRTFSGSVSAANSLVGTSASDQLGSGGVARAGNDYVVASPLWDNAGSADAGAITLARGSGGSVGSVVGANSVQGTTATAGATLVFAADATRDVLVVGQPAANRFSIFQADLLFANGFD